MSTHYFDPEQFIENIMANLPLDNATDEQKKRIKLAIGMRLRERMLTIIISSFTLQDYALMALLMEDHSELDSFDALGLAAMNKPELSEKLKIAAAGLYEDMLEEAQQLNALFAAKGSSVV